MASSDFSAPQTAAEFRDRLTEVKHRIADAAAAAGRPAGAVRLLPVSKTVPAQRLRLAIEAGMTLLGENKVQEASAKAAELADTGVQWAVIGHLQRNKAKDVAAFATEFQALDSLRLAEALNRRLEMVGRELRVLVQVNTSAEPQKYGLAPDEVAAVIDQLPQFPRLKVSGLMTLAEFSSEEARVRACFSRLRELQQRLAPNLPDGYCLDELSMGMSGDFEWAIAEGSTTVRLGQTIFGPRPTPDSHYWPGETS